MSLEGVGARDVQCCTTRTNCDLERPDVPGNLDHAIRLFESARSKDPAFALASAGLAPASGAQVQETKEPSWTAQAR